MEWWLKMAGNGWIGRNGGKLLKIAENGWQWLAMASNG